ncbi:MAG: hypothetical protein NXI20_00995 [bacterium]|nr:hypothetical protein [bacterium]
MSLNKWFLYLSISIFLASSCNENTEQEEVSTLAEATKTIKNFNLSRYDDIKTHVANMGNRPLDMVEFQKLESLLRLVNNWKFSQNQALQDTLLNSFEEDPRFQQKVKDQILKLTHYSTKIDSTNISEMGSVPEANCKLTIALLEDRIINYYYPKFGVSDNIFSQCCGVNAATNYDNTQVGKPTSIILQNESHDVEMKFSKVRVMVADEEIEAEITEMNKIVLVNFTPNKKGDYRVQFMSSVESYDTTITQNMDISLTDIADK